MSPPYVIGRDEIPAGVWKENQDPGAGNRIPTWEAVYEDWLNIERDHHSRQGMRWRNKNAQNQINQAQIVKDAPTFVKGWFAQFFVGVVDIDPTKRERQINPLALKFNGTNFAGEPDKRKTSDEEKVGESYVKRFPRPAGSNQSEEYNEWMRKKKMFTDEHSYQSVLNNTGRAYMGQPTRSIRQGPTLNGYEVDGNDQRIPNSGDHDVLLRVFGTWDLRKQGVQGLFEADVTDYSNRFDCYKFGWDTGTDKLKTEVWVSVFTNEEYKTLQQKLNEISNNLKEAINSGLEDARGGPITTLEKQRAINKLNAKIRRGKTPAPKKPLSDADLRLRLVNAQAMLILSMAQIRQMTGTPLLRQASDPKFTPQPSPAQISRARHHKLISYDDDPSALINLLANPFPNKDFLNATPDQLGRLQPKLEFRIDGKLVPFPEYTSEKKLKQLARAKKLSPTAQENFLQKRSWEGTDVGIKTFDWTFENKMEGNSTIKAHLVLHFKSMLELLNQNYLGFVFGGDIKGLKRPSLADRRKALMARLQEMNKGSLFAPLKDGGCDPKSTESLETSGITRPEAPSELTVMVGWQTLPAGNSANSLGISKTFREGVTNTQRMLRLKMIKYDLAFNQNGSVDLTLEYIGGLDALLASPDRTNIFNSVVSEKQLSFKTTYVSTIPKPDDANELNSVPRVGAAGTLERDLWPDGYLYKQFKKGANQTNDYADKVPRFGVTKAGIQYELRTLRELKKLSQDVQAPQRELELISLWSQTAAKVLEEVNHIHQDKMFSSFMDSLVLSKKLYYVTVGRLDVRRLNLSKAGLGSGKIPYQISIGGNKVASAFQAKSQADNLKKVVAANMRAKTQGKGDVEGKFFLDPTRRSECIDEDLVGNHINLFYFKLGDLVDGILKGMAENCANPLPNQEIIMGSFYPFLVGIPKTSPDDIYAISDIPISLDYFGHWFLKNYTARQSVPQASFRRFIDDLMMDLVAPLFNRVLKMPNAPMDVGRFTFGFTTVVSPLSMPAKISNKKDPSRGRLVGLTEMSKMVRSGTLASKRDQKEYFVVTAKQVEPALTGNKKFDESIGIYHMVVGSDRGLVKNFNFSQIDIPFYKEMRIEQNNQGDALFIPQNVELKLVGNAFFRNSSQVFVDANFGLGASAEKLGIGGYYTVTRVSNSISPGKFETTLSCVFVKKRSAPTKSRRRGGGTGLSALDARAGTSGTPK